MVSCTKLIPSRNSRRLSSAEIVVAGGKSFGSAEAFPQYLVPLAAKLNAAVGATRAAVDAGYAPTEWQIGQTGQIITPKLYVAFGISGPQSAHDGCSEDSSCNCC
ncbi:MAG: FAD-binding protein [Candidatus Hodgkinia cicadicola]